jgi:hypothetical protein
VGQHASERRDIARRHGRSGLPILTIPDKPNPRATISLIAAELGRDFATRGRADIAIWWDGQTLRQPDRDVLDVTNVRVLNLGCTNVSKSRVSAAYEAAFGRDLLIDPTTHTGLAVEKNEINGTKDGRAVQCPTARRPGYAYQRLVNNTCGDFTEDIRIPVFGSRIPLVFLRYRPRSGRFSDVYTSSHVAECADLLTDVEVAQINAMCRTLGMDYGELDALRDQDNGVLYVVDANPTPYGPPNQLARTVWDRVIRDLATAFSAEFL